MVAGGQGICSPGCRARTCARWSAQRKFARHGAAHALSLDVRLGPPCPVSVRFAAPSMAALASIARSMRARHPRVPSLHRIACTGGFGLPVPSEPAYLASGAMDTQAQTDPSERSPDERSERPGDTVWVARSRLGKGDRLKPVLLFSGGGPSSARGMPSRDSLPTAHRDEPLAFRHQPAAVSGEGSATPSARATRTPSRTVTPADLRASARGFSPAAWGPDDPQPDHGSAGEPARAGPARCHRRGAVRIR